MLLNPTRQVARDAPVSALLPPRHLNVPSLGRMVAVLSLIRVLLLKRRWVDLAPFRRGRSGIALLLIFIPVLVPVVFVLAVPWLFAEERRPVGPPSGAVGELVGEGRHTRLTEDCVPLLLAEGDSPREGQRYPEGRAPARGHHHIEAAAEPCQLLLLLWQRC